MAGEKRQLTEEEGMVARYSAETQDYAYQHGAYDYFLSIDMVPRMATIAAYARFLGVKTLLDVGCGWADLLSYLGPEVTYLGLDISQSAIGQAEARFAGRPGASFHVADFRDWQSPIGALDCVVWAGIGRTWTRDGRKGKFEDWLEILDLSERPLKQDGWIIVEMVGPHWETLERLIEGRYHYKTGCDIDHLKFDHLAKRSIRVLQRIP